MVNALVRYLLFRKLHDKITSLNVTLYFIIDIIDYATKLDNGDQVDCFINLLVDNEKKII